MNASLKPQIFISWIPYGKENLRPQIWVTILPTPKHRETVRVDTKRRLAEAVESKADSQRQVCSTNRIAADTRRTVTSSAIDWTSAKLLRHVAQRNTAAAATRRCVGGS